jgi:cellulose synthase/poly-beta-1,6-N-acetylglucosamine synthase-like glycosyltransferase
MRVFEFSYFISLFFFVFIGVGMAFRFIMLLLSISWIKYEKKMIDAPIHGYPKVSLLIPAYNEENVIVETVTHVINADYPELEIIVINDGSQDSTLALLISSFELRESSGRKIVESIPTQQIRRVFTSREIPNLIVIDKENGGKADALNCGINASTAEYVLAVDADTHLTQNTIRYLVKPVIQDPHVVVTSGSVRILSEKGYSLFANLQKIEFVNSISLFRTGWNFVNANLIVSGALGLFQRKLLLEINGYHNLAIGEDMELIVRIHRHLIEKKASYKVLQFSLPTCFTSAVPNLDEMIKQRKRWQKGLLSSLRLNTRLFFNPRYKGVGLLAIPYYIFFEIMAPFIELLGLVFFIFILLFQPLTYSPAVLTWATPLGIWIGGIVFAVLNDWLSISIDKFLLRGMSTQEYGRLLLSSIVGLFFYHFVQLYCKIKGTFEYLSTIQISTKWDTQRKKT